MQTAVTLTVYPDECDAFGHLNQASYLALFERARWELLARGPGMDAFARSGVWPAVRRATVDYHAGSWPGDRLEFTLELVGRGRTSFTLRQRAVRVGDHRLVATAELVFVCIDQKERPVAVPEDILAALGAIVPRITLPDGGSLAYEDVGSGGVPVVFVHGYPLDRTMWRAQLGGISSHRLIAPDLRGFGESSLPPEGMTIADHADDLAQVIDSLKLGKVVIAGLSMGGYVAIEFARRHRELLAGLVLMDTRAEPDDETGKAARDAAIRTAEGEGGVRAVARSMADKLFASEVDVGVRDQLVEQMARTPVEGVVSALAAMRDRHDGRSVLAEFAEAGIPAMVMVGSEDSLTPPSAARTMVELVPEAEFIEVEGAGHLPPIERPATVNEALQRFLDRQV